MSNGDRDRGDGFRETLDLMILQALATLGSLHGYAIAARVEELSAGTVRVDMGTLYPALMRLEQRGLVRSEWGTTGKNRKARFYTITAAGRRRLAAETGEWDRVVTVVEAIFNLFNYENIRSARRAAKDVLAFGGTEFE